MPLDNRINPSPPRENLHPIKSAENLTKEAINAALPPLTPGKLLRISQFIPSILPIAKSTFWAGVKSGKYPKPIKLSERVTCWRSEDIMALRDNTYQNAA